MYPKHFQTCCRLCLSTSKKQLEIFAVPELSEMLQTLYKLEIPPTDDVSTSICVDCYYEAKVSCNWLRVHRKLKQQFEANQAIFEKQLKVTEPIEKVFGINWKTNSLLKNHLSQQHQIRQELLNWDERIAIAAENDPARCEICSSVFPDARSLRHHKLNVHKIGLGQPSNPVPERQPMKRVHRSRSTRAMENYPEPTGRTTRRSKSIACPVELLQAISQPPACRTRSKSQDVDKLLAEAATKDVPHRFFCDICGHGFASKYRVVRHKKKEHKVPNPVTHVQGSLNGADSAL
uniref:(northern house mosquito) hypothetical protein n=1 Tax=Culex pipiens TaxID=7175 RepID=A0A8D8MFQ6_CULPI